jgi:autotransporter-associated beta strand protein
VRVGRQGSVKATLTVTDTAIFTDTGAMAIGAAGNCQGTVYVQKSGTLSATEIDLGTGGSAQGTMYIQGSTIDSTIATVNVSGVVVLGTTGTSKGTIYVQDNGLLSVNGNLNIGTGSSVTSKVYVQGSGALYSKAYIYVGATAGGQGELDISGNAYLNISGGAGGIWIGDYSSGTAQAVGVVNQTGGTVEIYGTGSTNLWQGVLQVGGNQGKGTYNLEAGLFTLYANTNGVSLTWYGSGSVGIFNLDGGTLVTPNVRGGSPYGHGTSTFNFNGGTLMADSSNNAFMSTITHIYVKGGGAIIDDNGAIIGIAQNLESGAVSDGGLTKNGIGTLTLSGNNSYNGATVVNAGTLIVSGSYTAGGGDFTVNSGATLQSGINLNRALIVNGGTVNPGYSPGTLTVTGLKSYDGSAYNFELSNNTKAGGGINDLIAVNGNVTLSGTSTINVSTASYLLGGTYTLITYTGAITGGSANLSMSPLPIITLPVGARPYTGSSFSVIPGAVQLTIQGGPLATNVWMGGKVGSEKLWDTNTTTNWNSSNNLFAVLDCAQFTGNTPGDIDIVGQIQSSWVTVDSAANYNFMSSSGAGYIDGVYNGIPVSYLVKKGAGTLTISNAGNVFVETRIEDGTLKINNAAALDPSGAIIVGAPADPAPVLDLNGNNMTASTVTLVNGQIIDSNPGIGGPATLTSTNAADLRNGLISANLSLTNGFMKTTSGTVTLQGPYNSLTNNCYVGISEGTVIFDSGSVVDGNSAIVPGDTTGLIGKAEVKSNASVTCDYMVVGNGSPAIGILNVEGGTLSANNTVIIGGTGNGYGKQTSGTVSAGGWFSVADSYDSFGSYEISGGTLNVATASGSTGVLAPGNAQFGIFTVKNNAVVNLGNGGIGLSLWYGAGIGILNQYSSDIEITGTGDDFADNNLQLGGNSGTGIYNQLGGTVNSSGGTGVAFAWSGDPNIGGVTGIYNLGTGAVLKTTNLHSGSPWGNPIYKYSYFNFHGGTLVTLNGANNSNFIYEVVGTAYTARTNGLTAVTIWKEGAKIDTDGNDITIASALEAPAGNGVSDIAVTSGGSGYKGAPMIKITGNGVGATAVANMKDNGDGTYSIDSITITNPGTNYTSASVSIIGGDATTSAVLSTSLANNDTTGGLTKLGSGILTLTGALTYGGTTTINAGTLQINTTTVAVTLADITGASDATLGVGDGTNATSLTATSVDVGTLTIGAGSTLTIAALPSVMSSGSALAPVPEPSIIVLLALAGLGLLIGAMRNRRS